MGVPPQFSFPNYCTLIGTFNFSLFFATPLERKKPRSTYLHAIIIQAGVDGIHKSCFKRIKRARTALASTISYLVQASEEYDQEGDCFIRIYRVYYRKRESVRSAPVIFRTQLSLEKPDHRRWEKAVESTYITTTNIHGHNLYKKASYVAQERRRRKKMII